MSDDPRGMTAPAADAIEDFPDCNLAVPIEDGETA